MLASFSITAQRELMGAVFPQIEVDMHEDNFTRTCYVLQRLCITKDCLLECFGINLTRIFFIINTTGT